MGWMGAFQNGLGRLAAYPRAVAVAVLVAGLLSTAGLTRSHGMQNRTAAALQLQLVTSAMAERIRLRLAAFRHVLFELRGMATGKQLDADHLKSGLAHRLIVDLAQQPGIRAIGYARRSTTGQAGDQFVVSEASDPALLGQDLGAALGAREAGMRAIWRNETVLSRPVPDGDAARSTLYLMLPIFPPGGLIADDAMQRRELVQGWLFVQFSIDQLAPPDGDSGVYVSLVDRESEFETYPIWQPGPGQAAGYEFIEAVGGRNWVFTASPTPLFFESLGQVSPWVTAVSGGGLSVALAFLAYLLLAMQQRVKARVEVVTGALQESEQRQRALLDNASVGMLFTVDRRAEQCNPKAAELFGWPSGDAMQGMPGRDFWPSDEDYEEIGRRAGPVLAAGHMFEAERVMQRKDGSTFLANVRARAVAVSGGRHGAIWVIEDVTERRRLEQQLVSSERSLSQILEGSPVAMFVVDATHRVTHWNQACVQLTGLAAAAIVGTDQAWMGGYEDRRPVLANIVLDQLSPDQVARYYGDRYRPSPLVAGAYEAEDFFPGLQPSGRWLHFMAAPLRDLDGRIIGAVETLVDITARREAELLLERRSEALEKAYSDLGKAMAVLKQTQDELVRREKLAALGELVAGVAHELNTPIGNALTVISSLDAETQTLVASFETGLRRSEMARYLERVQQGSRMINHSLTRAADLIASFKRLAVSRNRSERRQFPVDEVARLAVATVQAEAISMNATLVLDVVPGLAMESYPAALLEVLEALLENALVHGVRQGAGGRVTLRAAWGNSPERVVIEVCDDGQGIAAEVLPRVFDPFFTTRLGGGTSGLGLHQVYNLVTGVLGGEISVVSAPGSGTCFSLRVPASPP